MGPQYWINDPRRLDHDTAPDYLDGFLELLLDVLAERDGAQMVDMAEVLERIEKAAPGLHPRGRLPMLGIYSLWHAFMKPEHHRPGAERFLRKHGTVLHEPTITAFAVNTLQGTDPEWSLDAWRKLARDRAAERRTRNAQPMPALFDAALHATLAAALDQHGYHDEALAQLGQAVEEAPGNERLMAHETEAREGAAVTADIRQLLLGRHDETVPVAEPEPAITSDSQRASVDGAD